MTNDWLIWQLVDSAFPAGGFAHSGGLESAWLHGQAPDDAALVEFLRSSMNQVAHGMGPFVLAAAREPEGLIDIDRQCELFLRNHVANRASRTQGESYLTVCERVFALPALSDLRRRLRQHNSPTHFAPVFGAVARLMGLEPEGALELFLFFSLRGGVSSAVRLGIIGPMRGQSIQYELSAVAQSLAAGCGDLLLEDVAQTSPVLDLLQETHDRAYSRLFQS